MSHYELLFDEASCHFQGNPLDKMRSQQHAAILPSHRVAKALHPFSSIFLKQVVPESRWISVFNVGCGPKLLMTWNYPPSIPSLQKNEKIVTAENLYTT